MTVIRTCLRVLYTTKWMREFLMITMIKPAPPARAKIMRERLKTPQMKVIITLMIFFWLWGVFSVATAHAQSALPPVGGVVEISDDYFYEIPSWSWVGSVSEPFTFYVGGGCTYYNDGGTSDNDCFVNGNISGATWSYMDSNTLPYTLPLQDGSLSDGEYISVILFDDRHWSDPDASKCDIDTCYIFSYSIEGGIPVVTPPEPLTNTRIVGNYSPPVGFFDPATTTAVTLEFDYISNIPVPDTVGIELQNIGVGFQYTPQTEPVLASGQFTFSTTTPTLSSGIYQWRAVLSGDGFDYYSPWRLFSIGTSPDQSFIPVPDDAEFGCEEGNWLSNTLCSFMAWAFIPPATTMNNVLDIWQGLSDVKPFGYVIQVIDLRGSMEISDPAYTLETLPLMTSIFEPIRTGLAVIMWVLFLFYLYNRFKIMDI